MNIDTGDLSFPPLYNYYHAKGHITTAKQSSECLLLKITCRLENLKPFIEDKTMYLSEYRALKNHSDFTREEIRFYYFMIGRKS